MAEEKSTMNSPAETPIERLEAGTYEVIRNRLAGHAEDLQDKLQNLNKSRKDTFGSIDFALASTERITTLNNCIPRDMAAVGSKFIFGYNVYIGLKSETVISDVFAVYEFLEGTFRECKLETLLADEKFEADFRDLYKYYKQTTFQKFTISGNTLFMVFQVGHGISDIKTFKWAIQDNTLIYIDNRSDHECKTPVQQEFEWTRTRRDDFRFGTHPHISIKDRIFVETTEGDLTIKVEDNTETGEGIYSEPVDNPDQTLDDPEIFYAILGNLILLKIRPYQEKDYRYIIFSEKIRRAVRLDEIENACLLLPEDQGIIFPKGYYLQSGEYKKFDLNISGMRFEKRIHSPNGEDTLFIFHNPQNGVYVAFSYNLIAQKVDTPLICGGLSIFEDGTLINFKETIEPQKHHAIQIWKTPYMGQNYVTPSYDKESFLFKVGNRDIVRCMAEIQSILNLLAKDDSFSGLYLDIVKGCTDILDTYFWVSSPEAFEIGKPLEDIRNVAGQAIEEFDKVTRIRKDTAREFSRVSKACADISIKVQRERFNNIDSFVQALSELRKSKGEIISLKDLRYVVISEVKRLEKLNSDLIESLSGKCIQFLAEPNALDSYRKRARELEDSIEGINSVVQAKACEANAIQAAKDLQMLIEIVSNLKIDDAIKRTEIIEAVSSVFAEINKVRAAVRNCMKALSGKEAKAEFNSQMKLLEQTVLNALDICDTPEKCDEQMTAIMLQMEEIEGKFADFEEFAPAISEKRHEAFAAFESQKLRLVEAATKRSAALMTAAERILQSAEARINSLKETSEIHSFFASDLMIDKVRSIITDLRELKDSVRADDLQSRLKALQENGIHRLKDKKELYLNGESIIKLGNHNFSVNRQPLDITFIERNDDMYFHITGTGYFERVGDNGFNDFRDLWNQDLISETTEIYRSEYLAWLIRKHIGCDSARLEEVINWPLDRIEKWIRDFMSPRYAEGFIKGVHDHDAALILKNFAKLESEIGLLKYSPAARAAGGLFWNSMAADSFFWDPSDLSSVKAMLEIKMKGLGLIRKAFPINQDIVTFKDEVLSQITAFNDKCHIFDPQTISEAADFLFEIVSLDQPFPATEEADRIYVSFLSHLDRIGMSDDFRDALKKLHREPTASFKLCQDWIESFLKQIENTDDFDYRDEAAFLLTKEDSFRTHLICRNVSTEIREMAGSHPLIVNSVYKFNFNRFSRKMKRYFDNEVPRFHKYSECRQRILNEAKKRYNLSEFKPSPPAQFVRNSLIDKVYLPLIGANLAKQIGVIGEKVQPDRMGLLLLISPPGYGKTTLMEYVAARLGLIFIKINGPAIGNRVTCLDPAEAPNSGAREEIKKLNLALAMSDNLMLYIDDIQHCNTEFLEKFISLCDAQRKIEGVINGESQSYDLRGKKVAVVMAGNPYTESGERFQIPDMLANRADTFNLGDIVSGQAEAFRMSFLENAATSNPVLAKIASKSTDDIKALVKAVEQGNMDGLNFEGTHPIEDLTEAFKTMQKLHVVRNVVLSVNAEYIKSAAQAEEYRSEPPFKLQGSYRNMNRMAQQILPIMNDAELDNIINDHYRNEAQTLAGNAESNYLRFLELRNILLPDQISRLAEIRATYKKNALLRGISGEDRIGQLMAQIAMLGSNLEGIKSVLAQGLSFEGSKANRSSAISTAFPEATNALSDTERTKKNLRKKTPKEQ